MEIMEKKMETTIMSYMGGCQNYGPFWGTLNIRCRLIIRIQKGTIILSKEIAGFHSSQNILHHEA